MTVNPQQEYWNGRYSEEGRIWGVDSCLAAKMAGEVFGEQGFKKVLVPGCGYGRNALYLQSKGFDVTGFDISDEAVRIAEESARKQKADIKMRLGDVLQVELNEAFDGILSINMLHLFNEENRHCIMEKFTIALNEKGILILTSMSVNDPDFGKGEKIAHNTYESKKGRPIYYFDEESMRELASKYGEPLKIEEIKEFENHGGKEHYHRMMYLVLNKR